MKSSRTLDVQITCAERITPNAVVILEALADVEIGAASGRDSSGSDVVSRGRHGIVHAKVDAGFRLSVDDGKDDVSSRGWRDGDESCAGMRQVAKYVDSGSEVIDGVGAGEMLRKCEGVTAVEGGTFVEIHVDN